MQFRVTSWGQVFGFSVAITVLSISVPVCVVAVALWGLPWEHLIPVLAVSGLIPLFIAFPISVFALNILRNMNSMMVMLDSLLRFDSLTGLLNRSHFYQLVQERRRKKSFLAIVDADHFKQINDRFGHDAGDEALKFLGQQLGQVFGPYGLVGRLGGEEFGIYVSGQTVSQLRLLVSMLRTNLRANNISNYGHEISVTVSLGIAEDDGTSSFNAVVRSADKCLYAAKHAGRDCCYIANDVDDMVRLVA
jgi:diguanylate cyclase